MSSLATYQTKRLTIKLMTDSSSETCYNVYLKDSDRCVGYINIMHYMNHQIWYTIDPNCWRRGYATEAVAKVLDVTANKDELYLDIRKSNLPSIRVAEKLGFILSTSDATHYQFRLPKPK